MLSGYFYLTNYMKLAEIDTGGLKYDPKNINSLKKLEKEYPEFTAHLNAGLGDSKETYNLEPFRYDVMKYIVLLYDKNSPLWGTIQDINQRKITALQLAGFETQKNGHFIPEVQQGIYMGKNSVVNHMIIRYVFQFNNPKFVLLVGLLQVYINLFSKIQESNPKKDDVIMFKQTAADIERLTSEIFGGKETQELENALYEELHMNKMLFRPENVADRIAAGESPTNVEIYEKRTGKGKVL